MQNTIYVSKETNTSCSFQTITAALESIPENNQTPITISIAPGTYREKLTINKPCLTLVSEGDSITHGQAIALYADGDRLMIDS